MKAKIFSLMALVLCLVSCQTEPEGLDVIVGGEVDTVVTVTIPEAETRANTSSLGVFNNGILEDENVTMRYILEIYYGDESRDRLVDYSDGTEVAFPVRLVPDRHYNFVVWADVVTKEATATEFTDADNHYNTTNLKAITLNGEWDAMDETRDAFTGYFNTVKDGDKKPYNGSKAINIPLIRPFAKLRVITTDFDELAKYGIVAKSGQVSYSSEYRGRASFNAYNGEPSDAVTSFLGGSYDIVEYASENGGDEHTIFSDYIFASTDGDVVKFDLDIYDLNGGRIKYNNFNTDIRVKRNYITTLKGDVLTTSGNVTVTVNPGFEEDEIVENYVDTAEDLQDAIENAEDGKETVVVLGGDVNLDDLLSAGILSTRAAEPAYGLVIPAGKKLVLDLNGKRVYQTKACSDHYSMILNNGDLTITGEGTVEFENTSEGGSSTWGTYTIENRGEAVLTIDNATIRHNGCVNGETNHDTNIAIQNYEGKVVINDGTIASPEFRSLRDFTAGGEIIINGGTFLGQVRMQGLGNGSSSLTINGGSFSPVEGYDGSSVYITNSANVVNVAITGGIFNTKVGCYDATKEGANGCITGGTFTTAAKEATNEALLDSLYEFVDNDDDTWTVSHKNYAWNEENTVCTIYTAAGLQWFANEVNKYSNYEYPFKDQTVLLANDIDLGGIEWTPIGDYRFSANRFCGTFDGQNYTISNFKITKKTDKNDSNKSSYGFFGNVEGIVKNLTIADANVSSYAYTGALIGRLNSGCVENCHVVNSAVSNTYWQGGILIGQVNGSIDTTVIKDCTVSKSSVSSKSAIGAISGPITASDDKKVNELKITVTGCRVNDCEVIQTGSFGGNYDKYFGSLFAYLQTDANGEIVVSDCTAENTLVKGEANAPISGDNDGNIIIDGLKYVSVGSVEDLTNALKGGVDVITLGTDITVTEKWDNRYTGAKTSKAITIDGNGNTLKFACEVSDGFNYQAAFRFEAPAVVKNLTIDMSEVTGTGSWLRAISTKGDITVDNCTFIGSTNYTSGRGIAFGEGAGVATEDIVVSVKNSTFTNWTRRGLTDNENAQDAKNVTVVNNTFTNADAYVSAHDSIVFTGNVMNNSAANFRTYSNATDATVVATGNTLDANNENNVIRGFVAANVESQEGFTIL